MANPKLDKPRSQNDQAVARHKSVRPSRRQWLQIIPLPAIRVAKPDSGASSGVLITIECSLGGQSSAQIYCAAALFQPLKLESRQIQTQFALRTGAVRVFQPAAR